ncbi:hypothetical protein LBMAG42_51130 [Deltaproteobacteria bacterium]|nr:hypothetical protein LBMAG42_51130 [Deltaproteobacteria bacterium]
MLGARALRSRLLRATGLMHPEVVIFDVTHRCTSQCVGCAFRDPEPNELPTARWIELAREAKRLGFREIMVTGGEPLAHPEIGVLLPGLARELPVSLITNGLALAKHAGLVRATRHEGRHLGPRICRSSPRSWRAYAMTRSSSCRITRRSGWKCWPLGGMRLRGARRPGRPG